MPAVGPNGTWYSHNIYMKPDSQERAYHEATYGPLEKFGYKDFIPMFTAAKFDAAEWADLFRRAGARFAGPVAEHHDGFSMWDTALFGVERGQDGPQAGHRRRAVGGHQEGRIEVRHRLPPRRELVLLPDLGQALRLRRPALFRPLRSDPREGRPARQGLPGPVGGQGPGSRRQVPARFPLVRLRPGLRSGDL
ncbi:MAG: alpha-L-fucosidase [Candidatus Moduliflexus flocculans]|nr:alpha-L-fucosidase [Candidatus Moduliflexus flocculans]